MELNVGTWLGPDAAEDRRVLVRTMQRHALEVQLAAESRRPRAESLAVDVDPGQISVPTLVVSGCRDMDHFRDIAQHLARTIARARLETLEWAPHLPSLERPNEVNTLITRYLADCDT